MTLRKRPLAFLIGALHLLLAAALHEDPLIHFEFRESECANDTFVSSGLLDDIWVVRNISSTSFSAGNLGLESSTWYPKPAPALLQGPIWPLVSSLNERNNYTAQGITFNLWLRPLADADARTPIFTIGNAFPEENSTYGITECDRRQVDLQLALQNRSLTLLYRTSDTFFEPCQRILLKEIFVARDELTHIAIVLSDSHQQVFVNGKASGLMEEPFDPTLSHWNPRNLMHFFSYLDAASWHGRLYRLEVFEEPWSREDVLVIISQSPPSGLPYTLDSTHRINEDAEKVPGSHSAQWYEQPNIYNADKANETPFLILPIRYLDEDVENLLNSLGLNYTSAPDVLVYISRFPSRGALYAVDGSPLSSSEASSDLVPLQGREIVFMPEYNSYSTMPGSVYTTFEFCVGIHPIFSRSQCLSTSTINIVVDPVNDPPIAVIAGEQPYIVHEGTIEQEGALFLKGYDVDHGDAITALEISTSPKLGYLVLSVPVRRHDGRLHGALLSDIDNLIPGSEILLEYFYNQTDTIVRDFVVRDSFDFRARDSHGSWSVPARVTIQVVSAVTTVPFSESIVVKEDSSSLLPLLGRDQSGKNRTVGFFLEYVPEENKAALLGIDEEMLQAGTMLNDVEVLPPYEEKVGIRLQPSRKVCGGTLQTNVSFGYRAVAFEDSENVASVSAVYDQTITVECKIQPIGLAILEDHFTTHAFSSTMDDICAGYLYNSSGVDGTTCASSLIVTGIVVSSHATHTDRALVTIESTNGRLTINKESRSRLRLFDNQAVMRPSIEFLALPEELTDILAHLHFQSRVIGSDEIRISIQYGNCDDPDGEEDPFQCFSVEQSIAVEVLPESPMEQEMLFNSFPWAPLPFTFTMLLLMKLKGKMRILLGMHHSKDASRDEETTVADTTAIQWQQFYDDKTGFFYYLNLDDGSVAWDPPLNEDFIAWQEQE